MASKTDIANMALLKLGQPAIMSLDDNSQQAKLVAQELNAALEATLRAYPWPFAVKRIEVNRLTERPPFGFAYYYEIPSDSVRIVEIFTEGERYQIEGRRIATNAHRVALRYISNTTPIEHMDPQTADVLATALAARLAIVVTENPGLHGSLMQQYDLLLADARNTWANEDYPQEPLEGPWLAAHEQGVRSHSDTFNPWGPDGTGVSGGVPSGPGVIPYGG